MASRAVANEAEYVAKYNSEPKKHVACNTTRQSSHDREASVIACVRYNACSWGMLRVQDQPHPDTVQSH